MAIEGGSYVVKSLLREPSEALEEPFTRYGPDLLAKRFAFLAQPALSG